MQRAAITAVASSVLLLMSACVTLVGSGQDGAAPANASPATTTLLLHQKEGAEPLRLEVLEGRFERVQQPEWQGPLVLSVRRVGEHVELVVQIEQRGQLHKAGAAQLSSGDTLTIRSPRSFRGGYFGAVDAVHFEYVGPPDAES